jgi:hypothetical protein
LTPVSDKMCQTHFTSPFPGYDAATSFSDIAAPLVVARRDAQGFVPTIVNSLFDGNVPGLRAANLMSLLNFPPGNAEGGIEFPVIFPVCREFVRPRNREKNGRGALVWRRSTGTRPV